MNKYLQFARLTLCSLALSAPALSQTSPRKPLGATELDGLRARCVPALGNLRAGAVDRGVVLHSQERDVLLSAETQSPGLGEMRAGDDAVTILAVVLAVVLLILIL